MQELTISVNQAGVISFIYDDRLKDLLSEGEPSVVRASHVEPYHGRWWQVDMSPSSGPVLEPLFRLRSDALKAEANWLTAKMEGEQYDPTRGIVIYALLRSDGSIGYIGKSQQVSIRFQEHRRRKKWPVAYVILDYVKGGKKNLSWKGLEKQWIAKYMGSGIENVDAGGRGGSPRSAATKRKISLRMKGVKRAPLSEECKRKLSEALMGRPKPPWTSERRAKQADRMRGKKLRSKPGKKLSIATRMKMSESAKRYWAKKLGRVPHGQD